MKRRIRYKLVYWLLNRLTLREAVSLYFDARNRVKELRKLKNKGNK